MNTSETWSLTPDSGVIYHYVERLVIYIFLLLYYTTNWGVMQVKDAFKRE